jgi:hypothetical protein
VKRYGAWLSYPHCDWCIQSGTGVHRRNHDCFSTGTGKLAKGTNRSLDVGFSFYLAVTVGGFLKSLLHSVSLPLSLSLPLLSATAHDSCLDFMSAVLVSQHDRVDRHHIGDTTCSPTSTGLPMAYTDIIANAFLQTRNDYFINAHMTAPITPEIARYRTDQNGYLPISQTDHLGIIFMSTYTSCEPTIRIPNIMTDTASSLSCWRSPNYHYVSHAIPLSFLRVQQLIKDHTCITPTCRGCKVPFSTAHPPRQLDCGHVLCSLCISEKCIRENDCRCLICALQTTPTAFEYKREDEGLRGFPRMHMKLFRDAVSKALFGYRRCLEDVDFWPIEATKSHSRHGYQEPNVERGLCYVGQRERHKLTVAAMVIMGCLLPTQSTQEGDEVVEEEEEGEGSFANRKRSSLSPLFSKFDAELWLYAVWEGIDNLHSSVYHDTHAELTTAIVSETGKAANKIKPVDFEGEEMKNVRKEVEKVVALSGEFEDLIGLRCREMIKMNIDEYHRFWIKLHKWETGIAS